MSKPRYRYDWKAGWWITKCIDGSVEVYTVKNPITAWYRPGGSPVMFDIPGIGVGGGGGGGSSKLEHGRYMSDAESLALVEAMLRKRVLQ